MRAPFPIMVVGLALALSGCETAPDKMAGENLAQRSPTLAIPPNAKVSTEEQAIAAVAARMRREGRDPADTECHAKWLGEYWHVTAWRIMYPENTGGSRFVPGGYVTYRVSADGKVMATHPGY